MTIRTNLVSVVTGVAAVIVAAVVLLPKPNCCEKEDPELDRLTAAAASGDLTAISALFAQARRDGIRPMEEHWALEGGMRGEKALRQAFAAYFKGMGQDRQQRLISQIRERKVMLGAPCMLQAVGDPAFADVACD